MVAYERGVKGTDAERPPTAQDHTGYCVETAFQVTRTSLCFPPSHGRTSYTLTVGVHIRSHLEDYLEILDVPGRILP